MDPQRRVVGGVVAVPVIDEDETERALFGFELVHRRRGIAQPEADPSRTRQPCQRPPRPEIGDPVDIDRHELAPAAILQGVGEDRCRQSLVRAELEDVAWSIEAHLVELQRFRLEQVTLDPEVDQERGVEQVGRRGFDLAKIRAVTA